MPNVSDTELGMTQATRVRVQSSVPSARRGDLVAQLPLPRRVRREAGPAATVRLGLLHDLLDGLGEIERLAARLRRVPRRVDEELDAVALGILEVDRPRVPVGHLQEILHALVA